MTAFFEISFLFVLATLFAIGVRTLRLPLLVGHVLTGIVAGPLILNIVQPGASLQLFADLGVAALLFIIGLTLSPRVWREIGVTASVMGLGQAALTMMPVFLLARFLGASSWSAWYIALALTLSSTIVVSKVLSDQKALGTLHGKIAIGFLLVQDMIAALALLLMTSWGRGSETVELGWAAFRGLGIILGLFLVSKWILPKLTPLFARAQDALFMFALGWGMGLAGLFQISGLSFELGALMAGIALAASPYHHEMSSRMRIVRDFLLVVFFALLGTRLVYPMDSAGWILVGATTIFLVLIKPLIVLALMWRLGFSHRTSLLTAVAIGQMSEFSFLLLGLGVNAGHLSSTLAARLILAGVLSMVLSSWCMLQGERIYRGLGRCLAGLGWRDHREPSHPAPAVVPSVLLVGCHRLGFELLPVIKRWGRPYGVIDFDPGIVTALQAKGVPCWYGDAADKDLLQDVGARQADTLISTVPDMHVSRALLSVARREPKPAVVVLMAANAAEAVELYQAGATYVVNLHDVGGSFTHLMLERCHDNHLRFGLERRKHLAHLKTRLRHELLPSSDLHHHWSHLS